MNEDMRRAGRFHIDRSLIEIDPVAVKAVMGQCVIYRAEAMYATDTIEYWAVNEAFAEWPKGIEVPEYACAIHYEDDLPMPIVEWVRIF